MVNIDLSVIIVNFNTKKLLQNCLKSIKESDFGNYNIETIVVDNASVDGSLEMVKKIYPKVKILENNQNFGFSAANNKGIRQAKGRYILLLNSDTLVEKSTLNIMLEFMDKNPEYGAATCRVELPNSKLDPACHRGFPTPWAAITYFSKLERLFPKSKLFSRYHQSWKDLSKVHDIDVISGAFFMVRKKIINKVGLLDEGFFMYGEDIDWCMRMHLTNIRIAFIPSTRITHMKGMSGRNKAKNIKSDHIKIKSRTDKYFWETMKLFYKKHYAKKYPKIFSSLIFLVVNYKIKRNKDPGVWSVSNTGCWKK